MTSTDGSQQDYLADLVEWLWPGRHLCESPPGARSDGRYYVPLPSSRRPTVLVPTTPRRAAATVLRSYKPSANLRFRTVTTVASLVARAGALDLSPTRMALERLHTTTQYDIETYLGRQFGKQIYAAPYTSPPRANRKPVLHLLDAQGRTMGFAKLAWNELTDRLVAAEGQAVRRLGRAGMTHVEVPELLHLGVYRDHPAVVQSAVSPAWSTRVTAARLMSAMQEVATVAGVRTSVVRDSPYVTSLRRDLEDLQEQVSGRALLGSLSAVLDAAGGQSIVLGSWHGDWTPWNMTATLRGVALWDWERFKEGVPLGFDALHFALQCDLVQRREDPATAARALITRAPRTLAPFGNAHLAEAIACLYLVELGARFLGDGQAEAGARLGRIEEWLLPVLEQEVVRLTSVRDRRD